MPPFLSFHLCSWQALGECATTITPKALSLLVSHMLYYRFRGSGTAPIVAGLEADGTPVLCTQGEGEAVVVALVWVGDLHVWSPGCFFSWVDGSGEGMVMRSESEEASLPFAWDLARGIGVGCHSWHRRR